MSADVAPQGRRFRSTRLQWSIPYVDDDRLVFVARSTGGGLNFEGTVGLIVELLCCLGVGAFASRSFGAEVVPIFQFLGVMAGVSTVFVYIRGIQTAPYGSRIEPIRRLVIERGEREPAIWITRAWPTKLFRVDAGPRALVRATINTRDHLFLVLGSRVFELWASEVGKSAFVPNTKAHWLEQPLTGGEGSAPAGPALEGGGDERDTGDSESRLEAAALDRTVRLTPVIAALRDLLNLSPLQELRASGPYLRSGESGATFLMGLASGGVGCWVIWTLPSRLTHTLPALAPSLVTSDARDIVNVVIGALVGVVLILVQWGIARLWLRRRLTNPVEALAARLVAEAARVSPPSEGGAPYRGDGG